MTTPLFNFQCLLPVGRFVLYLLTVQPYPKHKSFRRCQNSTGPVADLLRKAGCKKYFLTRELCKSGKAHFHVLCFLDNNMLREIVKCRFASIDYRRCKTKVRRVEYGWNGLYSYNDVLSDRALTRQDEKHIMLYDFFTNHIHLQYLRHLGETRAKNRLWKKHVLRQDIEQIYAYVTKDFDPSKKPVRYSDWDASKILLN